VPLTKLSPKKQIRMGPDGFPITILWDHLSSVFIVLAAIQGNLECDRHP